MDVKLGSSKVNPNLALQKFLKGNPLANILIILDTHPSQDGQIVTKITDKWARSDILGRVSVPLKTSGNQQLTKFPGAP